jgi:hypothetical protein
MDILTKPKKPEKNNKKILKKLYGLIIFLSFFAAPFVSISESDYPKVVITNDSEYWVKGTVEYMSAFCKNDKYVVGPASYKRVKATSKERKKIGRKAYNECVDGIHRLRGKQFHKALGKCRREKNYPLKLVSGIWRAKSRGVCLVTEINGEMYGKPRSEKGKKSYAKKASIVKYDSTGTSYSKYQISAYSGLYRIFSADEHKRVTDTKMEKSPGFYFKNYTDWPISYSLDQLGCLYYGIIPTGEGKEPGLRKINTGAVWFTLRMHIQPDGTSAQSDWDCVEPVAELVGDVAMAIFTGGTATAAKLGAKKGVTAGIKAGLKKAAKEITTSLVTDYTKEELGKLLKKSSEVSMYGQYAGYAWPFQCSAMPVYSIYGGPKVYLDKSGKAHIGQKRPFIVKKTNSCGNKMMAGAPRSKIIKVAFGGKSTETKKKVLKKKKSKKNTWGRISKSECRGDGYKAHNKLSLNKCKRLCSEDKKCNYIDYATKKRRGTSRCELNRICKAKKDKRYDIFSKSGKKKRTASGKRLRFKYKTIKNVDCKGPGYNKALYSRAEKIYPITRSNCFKKCNADSKCDFFRFQSKRSQIKYYFRKGVVKKRSKKAMRKKSRGKYKIKGGKCYLFKKSFSSCKKKNDKRYNVYVKGEPRN